jgi:endonuclease YncB( thermonuclease family)
VTAAFPDYTYKATVVTVRDGDNCTLDMDLGFWCTVRMSCRLAGLNAIELASPGGAEAAAHLASLIPPGSAVTVQSVRPDKYAGRFDGVIFLPASPPVNVNARMIADGYAAAWDGTGSRPVPPWPLPAQ